MANFSMRAWIEENMGRNRSAVFVSEDAEGAEESEGGLEGYALALILENPPVLPWPLFGYVSEISVHRRPKLDAEKTFEDAMGKVQSGSQRREDAFSKAFDRTQRMDDLLNKKFEEAKKKAKDDKSKPRSPFDLD